MSDPTLESLAERVERLEEMGCIFKKRVEADRCVFRDRKGQVRLSLGLDARGEPIVELFDGWGKVRASLSVSEIGIPSLVLKDTEGMPFFHAP